VIGVGEMTGVMMNQNTAVMANPRRGPNLGGNSMFEGLFQPMHLLLVFGIALLVFGPKKPPELGKGIGESIRGFKSAMKEREESSDKNHDASL
jgi:sec-independent protein translocase protein TatA